jgi:CelD/BcsL family acetyltransferase involved in cellulose biosynthesis
LRVRVAKSAAELEQLRSPWEALFAANPNRTIFQQFEWNLLAAQVFAARESPSVVFAENDNGAAILPACARMSTNTLSFLGEELFDYRDYLTAGDRAPLLAAWQKLAELQLPFEVSALRGKEACARWGAFKPTFFCNAPSAAPDRPPQPKNMLALRRLLRRGAVIQQYWPSERSLISWLYEQKGRQGEPNLFADPLRRGFMEAAIQLPSSRCEIFTLELEGSVLAALVTFRDWQCRRFYTTYFDERWAKSSPGFALLCEVSQRTLAENLAYDFMTGEQSYKTRLASDLVPLYRVPAQQITWRVGERESFAAA